MEPEHVHGGSLKVAHSALLSPRPSALVALKEKRKKKDRKKKKLKICAHLSLNPVKEIFLLKSEKISEFAALFKLKRKAETNLIRKAITKRYNHINHKVQQQLREFDEGILEKLAEDVCQAETLSTMWKLFNKYKRNEEQTPEPDSPLVCPDGQYTLNDKEKLDEFSRHMHTVHQTPDNPIFDVNYKQEVDKEIGEMTVDNSDMTSVNSIHIKDFRELLCSTKSKSAPGEDKITYAVLKCCSDKTIGKICDICNVCLRDNVFPRQWKSAKVRKLPKPGKDHSKAVSYRPISLLSCLGKLYEKHIYKHLMKELQAKHYFKDVQAGYSKGRSAQEHLFRLAQGIMNSFKTRDCTIGLFLDVKAAFDAVWLNGLKLKIRNIGLSKQLENILYSFLDERVLRIFIDGMWSESVELEAGTPQGSCLSPILYLIFVNDATDNLNQDLICPSQFADDIGIWSSGSSVQETMKVIQDGVLAIENWCKRWFVALNP